MDPIMITWLLDSYPGLPFLPQVTSCYPTTRQLESCQASGTKFNYGCVKDAFYSILGPDLLGLTVAV